MEANAKKSSFKDRVNNAGQKAKDYAKRTADNVKVHAKSYGSDIQKAYSLGYSRGWDDAYSIPKSFGSKAAAACGYGIGIRNRLRVDKYTKHKKN